MTWRSLSTIFPWNKSRTAQAQLRLVSAYRAVFYGSPTKEDQELVLVDLAHKSGFYRVSPPSMSMSELRQIEGMRALYAHIYSKLNLNEADVQALQNAAQREAVVDEHLG